MTQFAIFYEPEDVSQIAGSVNAATLPQALKNTGKKYWNGGLSGWATAPLGHAPTDNSCPLCRVVVINGPQCSLAEFRQLLLDIGAFIGAGTVAGDYLVALSVDMGTAAGAVEPWP
jgi:hypothetical protein